jgi:hypothetical protein
MTRNKTSLFLLLVIILNSCSAPSQPTSEPSPEIPNPGPTATQSVPLEVRFEAPKVNDGISLLPSEGDNRYVSGVQAERDVIITEGYATRVRTNYLYFRVNDDFPTDQGPITVEFEYFDEGNGLILFEYDSHDSQFAEPRYKIVSAGFRLNTLQWKTESVVLTDARFRQGQNFGADFRLAAESDPLILRSIQITQGGAIVSAPTPIPATSVPAPYPQPLGDKAVFTYYFYWYDPQDHIFNMTDAAIDYKTMSWQDVDWHAKQLRDISESGIDVILPIYWYGSYELHWSQGGAKKLAEALELVRSQGITPPSVGLFMDTTSSQGVDLRQEKEQDYFYSQLKFFFTTIPQEYWARAEGERPIVWFYGANWPAAFDQSFIDYLYRHFEQDFGVRPYLVLENSWDYPTETIDGIQFRDYNALRLKYDAGYSWGGAISPMFSPRIASIGPGYDDHAVDDRDPPTITNRMNGELYKQNINMAIQCGSPWLAVETWNEYHEGTDIAESLQYGRQYIELSQEYLNYFKQGLLPESAQANLFGSLILFSASSPDQSQGLSIGPSAGDGLYKQQDIAGFPAVVTLPMEPNAPASYLYFQVDNGFYFNQPQPVAITVMYFDEGYEPIEIHYDTAQCGSAFNPDTMYRSIRLVTRRNTLTWKTAVINISNATFAGNQNWASDFRLVTWLTPLTISEVRVENLP